MLDRWTMPLAQHLLKRSARWLQARRVTADQVTVAGFAIGLLALPLLAMEWYLPALVVILLNRIADGLDGCWPG